MQLLKCVLFGLHFRRSNLCNGISACTCEGYPSNKPCLEKLMGLQAGGKRMGHIEQLIMDSSHLHVLCEQCDHLIALQAGEMTLRGLLVDGIQGLDPFPF